MTTECLLYARRYSPNFSSAVSSNPPNNPLRGSSIVYVLQMRKLSLGQVSCEGLQSLGSFNSRMLFISAYLLGMYIKDICNQFKL